MRRALHCGIESFDSVLKPLWKVGPDKQFPPLTPPRLPHLTHERGSKPRAMTWRELSVGPYWKGIRAHRGKVLAAFLKAIGFIIPLMAGLPHHTSPSLSNVHHFRRST